MKLTLILSALIAFLLSAVLGPIIIPVLRQIKVGQTEREDGPESHLKKTGTPTMGAFIFLLSILVVSLFLLPKYPAILPILLLTLGFGVVGFVDDFIKVVLKRSEGLTPLQKSALQLVVSLAYILYLFFSSNDALDMYVPFAGDLTLHLGWAAIPVGLFILVGTVNGSNFTDGVDGLETSVTAVLAAFFMVAAIGMKVDIAPIAACVLGALLGFLLYNVNKALVFMGDTGSLALGGFVVSCAYALKLELYLPILALVYFVEVLSVIMQVLYFKATHGKRIFRMAPIHHHFELGGWSEAKVVGVFTIVTVVLCTIVLLFIPTVTF